MKFQELMGEFSSHLDLAVAEEWDFMQYRFM